MIRFDNIDVILGSSGILADSASISSSNNLQNFYSIGNYESVIAPNGPVIHDITIDYTLKLKDQSLFTYLSEIKQNVSGIAGIRFEIGGLYGNGYITSLKMSSSENAPISCSVSFSCFHGLSGTYESKRQSVSYDKNRENIAHAWTTYFLIDTSLYPSTYEFSYDISVGWSPVYIVGSKTPYSVLLNEVEENISFVTDSYIPIDFSGVNLVNRGILSDLPNSLQLNSLSYLWGPSSLSLAFDLREMQIKSIDSSFSTNDFGRFRVTAGKYY